MTSPSSHSSGPRTWAVPIPWIGSGETPVYWKGQEGTFHTLVFFLGAASDTRVVLNVLNPASPYVYVAAYAGCVLAGFIIGAVIRGKKDDRLSRMWSATFALLGFDAVSFLATVAVHTPAAASRAASYVPIGATALVVCSTLVTLLLIRLFPPSGPTAA